MVEDFWGMLVPPLVGKSFYTLKQGHELRVEEMSDSHLGIVVSTGARHQIPRSDMEEAWRYLTSRGSLTRKETIDQVTKKYAGWIVALLAQMPGVEHRLNPITLSYREVK
jgi:hypothetical protein